MADDDIISEILDRIELEIGGNVLTPEIKMKVESDMRRKYGSDEPYVRKKAKNRNERIIAEWRSGKSTAMLAIKYLISERRVRQIINARQR